MEKNELVDEVLRQADRYQLQLIYTQIDRDQAQQPTFTDFTLGLDAEQYFYPASTVKLPTAVLTLERINELGIIGLDKHSRMVHGTGRSVQTPKFIDSTAFNLQPSVAQYIHNIFLYSDNDAYNRLFEFLGARYINEKLRQKGINGSRIIHRVGAPRI